MNLQYNDSTNHKTSFWKKTRKHITWFVVAIILHVMMFMIVAMLFTQLMLESEYLTPGFIHLQNNLGFILFCLASLFCALISGAILYQGMERKKWTHQENVVFYGGLLLASVFFLTGFQFLLFGEWEYGNPHVYLFLKSLTIVLFLMILVVAIRGEIKEKRNSLKQAQKDE